VPPAVCWLHAAGASSPPITVSVSTVFEAQRLGGSCNVIMTNNVDTLLREWLKKQPASNSQLKGSSASKEMFLFIIHPLTAK